jgi:hypothetical protein
MRIMRMAAVAALMGAFALVGTASASADTTSCNTSGSIKLSPGLTTTASVQNVTVKGALTGCSGLESEVTEGKFLAHFKTAEAISCETLLSPLGVGAAAEENKIVLKLKPKSGGNPQGTFSVGIHEGTSPLSGEITSEGAFSQDAIGGEITQSYTGGTTCGVAPEGKKKAKKVNKGTFAGTFSVS